MKPSLLKARWTANSGAALTDLLRQIESGNETISSPFGMHGGRLDLRGVVLPRSTSWRRVKLRSADLNSAVLAEMWLEGCTFEDVVFDEVGAAGIADHGSVFSHCSFAAANLRGAAIGYRGSQFRRVSFDRADFQRAIFIRPEFDEVSFSDCRLKAVDFNGASFRRCIFRGKVNEVWFRGGYGFPGDVEQFGAPRPNRMEEVSFEHAQLSAVTFSDGCDLSTVILPSDHSCRRYDRWKYRLEKLLELARAHPPGVRDEIELFCQSYLVHAPWQDAYILSIPDLRAELGPEVADLILNLLDTA